MKNLTIKIFLAFFVISCIVTGELFLLLSLFIPYSDTERNKAYIKAESESLAARCLNLEKDEAQEDIYRFASASGAYVKLREYDETLQEQGGDTFYYPLKFSDTDKEYVLLVTCSGERTALFKNAMQKSLPLVLLIAVLVSFIFAKFFSYHTKKPIVRMSKIAERMAEQDFGWYCPDERDDEIGVLAKSLNRLSDELSSALTKLNDKNLYLKNEISLEKEKERRRMLFFSGVSHELKTPISVVIGQIEGMQEGIGVYKDRDKYLEKCKETLRGLIDFINEILLVSHIDVAEADSTKHVMLDALLDEEIAFYDSLITEKKIELSYEVPDRIPFRGDEKLLQKAVGNILGNAFTYTPEGGKVKVKLQETQDRVILSVENGPAHIDEQHLPHLFEAFYRADASNKDGSGLGLYISGMVFEMCGAEYEIRNLEDTVVFTVIQEKPKERQRKADLITKTDKSEERQQ
ncbi:MAG: HAMP domain-containing histidine kinase [Lachnospiraceae bacterium]|nr:HAMP domain-containing histidine kinase [Lachnospiraceae bacterium]